MKVLQWQDSLPAKFDRMLKAVDFKNAVEKKSVAIKMHFGSFLNYTTVHPLFVKKVVDAVKQAGGSPFLTDVWGYNAERAYTPEVVGCPTYPVAGLNDSYKYVKKIKSKVVKEIEIGGFIQDADAMVVLSHSKGHGHAGYGGAIKNLGMGAVTGKTRTDVHNAMEGLFWLKKKCDFCLLCQKNCRGNAIKYDKTAKTISISTHHCVYCMRCAAVCPTGAIRIDMKKYRLFQKALAISANEAVKTFKKNRVLYFNVVMDVTPLCDCWGYSTPMLVPDVGILFSNDLVSIDVASLDLIDRQPFIEGSLPGHLTLSEKPGHLFERIWGKDPYGVTNEAEKLGMGSTKYVLKDIV